MLSNAQIKAIISANLADPRINAISLFLDEIISRKLHTSEIPQYRIKNINTDAYITDLAALEAAIDPNSITASYYYNSDKMSGDRTHPMSVVIRNLSVELSDNIFEDNKFTERYGKGKLNIMFIINYLSDGDTTLPLKIFEIKLV